MVGEKLKQAIEHAGIDRTQAASFIGVSEGNLYKMFKKDSFEIQYLRKAAELTGQPLSYFLGDDSQILQNSQKGESVGSGYLETTMKQIEQNLEMRYEKIIKHYEALLRRYEGQPVNFNYPAAGAKMLALHPDIEPESQMVGS